MRQDHARGQLDLLLLCVLTAGPAHGYAVISRLRAASDGVFDLPEGTVYPALHRLEGTGLVVSQWQDGGERRRRVYEITTAGNRALAAKRAQWRSFARGVQSVLAGAT